MLNETKLCRLWAYLGRMELTLALCSQKLDVSSTLPKIKAILIALSLQRRGVNSYVKYSLQILPQDGCEIRTMKVLFSPNLPSEACRFYLNNSGLVGIPQD